MLPRVLIMLAFCIALQIDKVSPIYLLPHFTFFLVNSRTAISSFSAVGAGVPQGNILCPVLNTVYTSDIPTHPSTILCTYSDDTGILAISTNPTSASHKSQTHLQIKNNKKVEN
uniref:Putative rna-directed dna polymerase from mobile element jockey-like protein n=1 Tax=Panstrongylus lignarius TaxID=156445 RepID=A0A224Y253_9HEMI